MDVGQGGDPCGRLSPLESKVSGKEAVPSGIARWRDTHQRLEMPCQMALIGEADGQGDLCRAQRCLQELSGPSHTYLGQVVVWRQTNHVAKDSQQVERADMYVAGKLIERYIFGVVIFQVVARLLHPRLPPSYGLE